MKHSTGKCGELAARLFFNRRGFIVDKVEPESHFVKGKGFIRGRTSGMFDFIGCVQEIYNGWEYRAIEVKEHTGETYPCSMLSREQTAWAKQKPPNTCFVAVYNSDYGDIEVFSWQEKGSYKRGEGIK